MKKGLALILALLMVLSLGLAACGNTNDGGGGGGGGGDVVDGDEEEVVKVHLLVTTLGDKSFNDSAYKGLLHAAEDFPIELSYTETGSDQSKYESFLLDTAESENGYDIIMTSSNGGWSDHVMNNAGNYPDIVFMVYDVGRDLEVTTTNVYPISFKQNECSYLVGLVAAAVSETNLVGCVLGADVPVLNDFLVGYLAGVRDYGLSAEKDVKVTSAFIGNFTDTPRGKELALAQANLGADVIYQVASSAGLGVLDGCRESEIFAIGVDSDQYDLLKDEQPDTAQWIITSALKNVGDALYNGIEKYFDGTIEYDKVHITGIAEGGVGYVDNENYRANTTEEVRAAVAEIAEKVKSGEMVVPSYFDLTAEEYEALKAEVGVAG